MNAPQIRVVVPTAMADSIARLHEAVLAAKDADPAVSRTARLLRAGRMKIAKKLAEETMEVIVGDLHGGRDAVIRESADLLYHLVVLWGACGVDPGEVWNEMDRRERLLGIAEKLPKSATEALARRPVIAEGLMHEVVSFPSPRAGIRR